MKDNKKTIIILSIVIALIIAGIVFVAILFFNKKSNVTTAKVKAEPITDTTTTIVEKNGNTVPFSDDSLSESERMDLREPSSIDINSSSEESDLLVADDTPDQSSSSTVSPQTNPNSPEATGVLQPVIEYIPIDVEVSEEQSNVVLSITKPTYILFVDLTQAASAQMLFTINDLSKIYNDSVDFVVISNFAAGKAEVLDYFREHEIDLPLYFDNGTFNAPVSQYHLTTFPHSFIIDKNCNIINSYSGYKGSDVVSANLDIISENFE